MMTPNDKGGWTSSRKPWTQIAISFILGVTVIVIALVVYTYTR